MASPNIITSAKDLPNLIETYKKFASGGGSPTSLSTQITCYNYHKGQTYTVSITKLYIVLIASQYHMKDGCEQWNISRWTLHRSRMHPSFGRNEGKPATNLGAT